MVRELRVKHRCFCFAGLYSDGFNIFAGVVWLVAVIIGSPMWHVQRLEVDLGLGLEAFPTPLNYNHFPS